MTDLAKRKRTGLRFVCLYMPDRGETADDYKVHAVHPDWKAAQETFCGITIDGRVPRHVVIHVGVQRSCGKCGEQLAMERREGRCP